MAQLIAQNTPITDAYIRQVEAGEFRSLSLDILSLPRGGFQVVLFDIDTGEVEALPLGGDPEEVTPIDFTGATIEGAAAQVEAALAPFVQVFTH